MRKTLIIAEAGVNHNGDIKLAKKIVTAAKNSGADIVKFQSFTADNLVTKSADKAKYQKDTTSKKESQYSMLKSLELSQEAHFLLQEFCKKKRIEFLSSAFDVEGLKFLKTMNPKRFKIPSGEITNYPYLRLVASFEKEVILSTGMANIKEIRDAFKLLKENGLPRRKIKILHCNTEYPSLLEDINLRAIVEINNKLGVEVGYSDHTTSVLVPSIAVALGAKIIEKHFTLDRKLPGPDHSASLIPQEFKKMVENIRNTELSLGNGIKKPSKSEKKNINIVRKSIVAKCKIKKGEKFTEDNLIAKRPGKGINPMFWKKVIGRKAKKAFKKDDFIVL